jgi:uncharacterized protein involved in cysteine biosynthesis
MEKVALCILIICNIPVFVLLISLFFKRGDLWVSIRFVCIPDIVSVLRGNYWEDRWAETKLLVLLVAWMTIIWSEIFFIKEHF